MADAVEGAAGRHLGRGGTPLTDFLCRLVDMTNDELREADPMKAAKQYGIDPNYAAFSIRFEQQGRGMKPLEWMPVEYTPPPPPAPKPPPDRRFAAVQTYGEPCPHGVIYPKTCDTCEENIRLARGRVSLTPKRRYEPARDFYES